MTRIHFHQDEKLNERAICGNDGVHVVTSDVDQVTCKHCIRQLEAFFGVLRNV